MCSDLSRCHFWQSSSSDSCWGKLDSRPFESIMCSIMIKELYHVSFGLLMTSTSVNTVGQCFYLLEPSWMTFRYLWSAHLFSPASKISQVCLNPSNALQSSPCSFPQQSLSYLLFRCVKKSVDNYPQSPLFDVLYGRGNCSIYEQNSWCNCLSLKIYCAISFVSGCTLRGRMKTNEKYSPCKILWLVVFINMERIFMFHITILNQVEWKRQQRKIVWQLRCHSVIGRNDVYCSKNLKYMYFSSIENKSKMPLAKFGF